MNVLVTVAKRPNMCEQRTRSSPLALREPLGAVIRGDEAKLKLN
jgi:hypothetical protein